MKPISSSISGGSFPPRFDGSDCRARDDRHDLAQDPLGYREQALRHRRR